MRASRMPDRARRAATCSRREFISAGAALPLAAVAPAQAVVKPKEYPRALRNPLMEFRPDLGGRASSHEYATPGRQYIKWNEIENNESDGIDKIRAYCDSKWKGVEAQNLKVIPRVYLHMKTHGAGIEKLGPRWKTAPTGGETAYDWGNYRTQPGDNPNDTLSDPAHRRFLINRRPRRGPVAPLQDTRVIP